MPVFLLCRVLLRAQVAPAIAGQTTTSWLSSNSKTSTSIDKGRTPWPCSQRMVTQAGCLRSWLRRLSPLPFGILQECRGFSLGFLFLGCHCLFFNNVCRMFPVLMSGLVLCDLLRYCWESLGGRSRILGIIFIHAQLPRSTRIDRTGNWSTIGSAPGDTWGASNYSPRVSLFLHGPNGMSL